MTFLHNKRAPSSFHSSRIFPSQHQLDYVYERDTVENAAQKLVDAVYEDNELRHHSGGNSATLQLSRNVMWLQGVIGDTEHRRNRGNEFSPLMARGSDKVICHIRFWSSMGKLGKRVKVQSIAGGDMVMNSGIQEDRACPLYVATSDFGAHIRARSGSVYGARSGP